MRAKGYEVVSIPAHMGQAEDIARLVEETVRAFGRLDHVVCNAAINPVFAPLQEITEDTWAKIMETNVTGVWRMAKAALPHIAEQGGGSMVLLSSVASLLGTPNGAPYAISKAAENHLARQLAVEWGPKNIRVNVIAPGLTRTDMIRNHDPEWVKRTLERTPLRRMGRAERGGGCGPVLRLRRGAPPDRAADRRRRRRDPDRAGLSGGAASPSLSSPVASAIRGTHGASGCGTMDSADGSAAGG